MHRRPPPEASPANRKRVTLVTSRWGDGLDERAFVTRIVAGAIGTRAEINVLHLRAPETRAEVVRDGAFVVHRLPSTMPNILLESTLLAALEVGDPTGRIPTIAGPSMFSFEGGFTDAITAAIDATRPDVLVVGGLQQAWPAVVIEDLSHRPRTVVLPLMGDDSRIGLPGYRDFIYRADVVCAISGPERERILAIDELMRVPEVREVPIAFPVNARAAAERVAGLSRFDHYVLFLRGFPRGTVPYSLVPDYARVRRTLNDAGIADVSHEAWRTFGEGFEYEVAVSPSRVNLWRLMSHAIATVDLRPGNLLGREVIESLLVGTPVLVPSGSWMRTLVEESGGGSAFASEDELIDQLARLEPPARHRQVADVGREWAQRKHGDHARFVAELTAVVLGDEDEMRSAV